jgi:hypothetical protein
MTPHHTSFLRRFAADTRGNILIIVGLAFLFLVGIAGAGYDLGMRELLRAHTQRAADFAATSAGGVEGSVTGMTDKQMREATALRYFNLNFGDSFLGEARPPLSLGNGPNSIDVTSSTITVQADGIMPTKFVKNLGPGHDTLDAGAYSQVAFTPINKPGGDVILLIDTSGSMLNNLAGNTPAVSTVSPIPGTVWGNPPSAANPLAIAPIADRRITIVKNSAAAFINALLTPANSTLPAAQQNRISIITWNDQNVTSAAELPFTSDNATAQAFLNNINIPIRGAYGTRAEKGLGRVIQNFILDSSGYFNPGATRVVVLLTDGEQSTGHYYEPVYTGANYTYCCRIKGGHDGSTCPISFWVNGVQYPPASSAASKINAILYTIAFSAGALGNNSRAPNLLSSCATDGVGHGWYNGDGHVADPINNQGTYFFTAATAAQLNAVFASIGNSIKKIRIVQ